MKMKKCYNCGKEMVQGGTYSESFENIGTVTIPGVKYYYCTCGEELVPGEVMQKVEEEYERLLSELLLKRFRSMDDINRQFMPNRELVKKLGKSRQAIAKDFSLKRKIYNVTLFGECYYLRESVELFLKTKDGRFPLIEKPKQSLQKQIKDQTTIPLTSFIQPQQSHYSSFSIKKEKDIFYRDKHSTFSAVEFFKNEKKQQDEYAYFN